MSRSILIVLSLIAAISFGADHKPESVPPNIIEQTQAQLGSTSSEQYMEFTTPREGFRVNYKIEGTGPYRLSLWKQEHETGGPLGWKQADILIHTARGNKVGAQEYRRAPPGLYRLQIIGQNASYHLIVDDPWSKPATQPASKPAK